MWLQGARTSDRGPVYLTPQDMSVGLPNLSSLLSQEVLNGILLTQLPQLPQPPTGFPPVPRIGYYLSLERIKSPQRVIASYNYLNISSNPRRHLLSKLKLSRFRLSDIVYRNLIERICETGQEGPRLYSVYQVLGYIYD